MSLYRELRKMVGFWLTHHKCDLREKWAFSCYMLWCETHKTGVTTGSPERPECPVCGEERKDG